MVIVFIVHGNPVVAPHPDTASVIGNTERVMGIEHISIHRLFLIVDRVSLDKSLDEIARKESFGDCPVGITVLYRIRKPTILVGEVVKTDIDNLILVKTDDRHRKPSVASHHLEGGDIRIVYLILLCTDNGRKRQKDEHCDIFLHVFLKYNVLYK